MNNLLIDTDVILDFFFDRMPHSEYAAMVLSLCEQNEINGFVTPVICCNVYYLLRQTAPHAKVIGKMRQLLSILDILPMDRNVVSGQLIPDLVISKMLCRILLPLNTEKLMP